MASKLRSLEILEVTHNYTPKAYKQIQKVNGELIPLGSLTEIGEADILVNEDNCPSETHLDLLNTAGILIDGRVYDLAKILI